MAPPDYWRVAISVPSEDVSAVRLAAPGAIPSERHAVITELLPDGLDGDTELHIEVLASDESSALDGAISAYGHVRALANLPERPPEVVGLIPPMFVSGAVYDRLWSEARRLNEDGRHELAVIRAQTACECLAREAVEALLRSRMGRELQWLAEELVNINRVGLNDGRTVRLIRALAGEKWRPGKQPWWGAYDAHLKRRNGIVHQGWTIPAGDAGASLDAVESCMAWLRELWAYG